LAIIYVANLTTKLYVKATHILQVLINQAHPLYANKQFTEIYRFNECLKWVQYIVLSTATGYIFNRNV